MLLLAGAQVLGAYMHNTVGVNIKGHFDLGHTAAGGHNAVQVEHTQGLVVLGKLTLTLQHVHLHGGLIVGCGGEDLALLGGDGGVALNDHGVHAAHGLNTQGQGRHIQQQQALYIAAQYAALQGSAHSYALIRVNALKRLFAAELLNGFLYGGNTGGTAYQQDLVNVVHGQAGVAHGLANRAHGSLNQVCGHFVKLGSGQGGLHVLGAGSVCGDEGQRDLRRGHTGQVDLGFLCGFLNALHSHFVAGQVNALLFLKLGNQPVHDLLIKVIAAQVVVTGCCQYFLHAVAHLNDGYIECTAAQVVDHHFLVVFLVDTKGQRRSGGLVDDSLYFHTGDLTGVLGGLALRIRKVSGHGDNRFCYLVAQVALCVALQLLQNDSADLLGGVGLAVNVDFVVGAHVALDGSDGALRIGDGLALCHIAHHALAVLAERHHGRGGAGTLCVGDHYGFAALNHADAAVCCT